MTEHLNPQLPLQLLRAAEKGDMAKVLGTVMQLTPRGPDCVRGVLAPALFAAAQHGQRQGVRHRARRALPPPVRIALTRTLTIALTLT